MPAYINKVHRLLRLIMLMQQGQSGNAKSLATALGVKPRTIYRDLSLLTEMGVPYYLDDETGGYRIRKDFFLPPLHLTVSEALAILALGQNIGKGEQIALTEPAATAIEKIRTQLPEKVLAELGELDRHLDIRLASTGPAREAISDVFQSVSRAIKTKRALLCRYESLQNSADEESFIFKPYALSFDQRAWYAIGHHAGRNQVRRLKLNRFTAIEPTDKPYAIPDDFSVQAFRGKAWRMIRGDKLYKIEIDFDPTVAETVADTHWHPTQKITDHPDGSITFTCQVEGLDEIVWWILGYGPHAKVIMPQTLAHMVIEKSQATARLYPADASSSHSSSAALSKAASSET